MAKKQRSQKRRSERKVLDAFHLAERAANGDDSGSDDDLQVRDGVMDARKFMKNQNNDDFEDEDLDSDEMLGSDDEYDVLNSKFSHTLREGGEEEDDEEYDSIDESQLVTLSEAWDLDDKDQAGSDIVLDEDEQDSVSEDESESDSESGSDSGSDSESESESESEDEEEMLRGSDDEDVNISSTLSKINASLKQNPEKKHLVAETRAESEFAVPTSGQELSLADMLAGANVEAPLIDTEDARALSVPLPKSVQKRHERKAAYEITKQDVSKWQESVYALRDADHLEFPLAPPAADDQEEIDAEAEYEALKAVPESEQKSELQNKIDGLLRQGALLDESNEATFEQVAAAKLSKEEMFKRTQELRRMRELMFRDEQRAKRIKKIKSKQYRKIHKRERLRNAEMVESEESDDDHDMKRAEERMSLRHKTQSKWAKSMIRSGITKDASTRAELEEMLRTGERLRAKQLGYEEGEQSDDNVSDLERAYANDDQEAEDLERAKLGKGVLAMDFMKAADEKRRRENKKELEFLRSMENSGIEQFEENDKNSINMLKNQGRRVYSPAVAEAKDEMEAVDEDTLRDYRDDDERSLEKQMEPAQKRQKREEAEKDTVEEEEFQGFDENDSKSDKASASESESDGENPWMVAENTQRSKKFGTVTQDSSKLDKAANKIAKHTKKSKSGKSSDTVIDLDNVMQISGNVVGSEDEEDDTQMFRQQNLIKEAFAGDDVVSEFQAEKRKVIEDEDDKEEDMTLPGWGGWGGADTKKPKKKFVRKIDGVAQKDTRRDKNLQNVIVNETVNKHNLKYHSSSVPFPYESKEQYERALRMPIGEEWASRATHQKATQPRVEIKQGVVIDPLKAPFK